MFQYAYLFIAGLVFGLANVIPGVSGGTMAVVFGIYERLIGLIADFRKKWRQELGFIISMGLGAGIAILLFGKAMDWVLANHPALANSFFVGVIVGSLPMLVKSTFRTSDSQWKVNAGNIVPFIATLAIMLWMSFAGEGESVVREMPFNALNAVLMVVYGVVAAACMIIPGISGSFVMVMMGAYATVINAVATLNIPLLIPFAIGALIGIFGCAKLIRFLLDKYEMPTYSAILGFVVGSIPAVFPGWSSIGIGAILCFAVGLAAILVCNHFSAE
ncbi:MAG: DUF368 domain-containing protein [Clostridia bacterium]|nr:DUF368 domain-containing protein [Clostridia bacterium]